MLLHYVTLTKLVKVVYTLYCINSCASQSVLFYPIHTFNLCISTSALGSINTHLIWVFE